MSSDTLPGEIAAAGGEWIETFDPFHKVPNPFVLR